MTYSSWRLRPPPFRRASDREIDARGRVARGRPVQPGCSPSPNDPARGGSRPTGHGQNLLSVHVAAHAVAIPNSPCTDFPKECANMTESAQPRSLGSEFRDENDSTFCELIATEVT